ncbi:diguanylate cyclase (GGDEF) domain-containing protein [Noviherbaspirillum humi]|uniref:diguanylate cyclase n=2 Tax=Noviherbaspirillum humi TaxID=1688639 RepID=A0A239IRU1_9BURK|nr:diguanylate cyclase (GGDEF) domain-containing protein [Noviherbaspirillum humi]
MDAASPLAATPVSNKPFATLEESLDALVRCLSLIAPMKHWMVTRLSGDDWSILHAGGEQREIARGMVLRWSDSFCSRMMQGLGPRFAADAQAVAAYREAPIGRAMRIGAYVGQPLTADDGTLLGTLCGVDPEAKPDFSTAQRELIQSLTRTMSTLLSVWMQNERARQSEARLRLLAETDALTGVANRHGWEALMREEEEALNRLSENALVMVIDLDGLKQRNDTLGHREGDRYIVSAARELVQATREEDMVARIGGDEFAVFVRGATREQGPLMHERIRQAFRRAGIKASIGYASRLAHGSLNEALHAADASMYRDKAGRKADCAA